MSWAEDTKLRLQVFALIMTVMCPAFLIWFAKDTWRQVASAGWPSVSGEVQGVTAKTWTDKDNQVKYYGRAVYRYAVAGKEYTSDLTDLGPGAKRADRETALADVSRYRPGMKVTVYYDPNDPSVGVLEKGMSPIHLGLNIALVLGAIIGACVSFFTVRGWLSAWRQHRRAAAEQRISPASRPGEAGVSPPVSLGDGIELFRPYMGNIVAGGIFCVLLVFGGLAIVVFLWREVYLAGGKLPISAEKGLSWVAVGLFSLLGLGLTVGGVFLTRYVRWLLAHDVEVCANGFRYRQGNTVDEVGWGAITSISETIVYERPPLLKGPANLLLPKLASRSYLVTTETGKEYRFDGDSVKRLKRFGELLRECANRAGVPWETVEDYA